MGRLTWRDAVATILVAVVLIASALRLWGVAVPLIADNGDVAAAGLLLGFAACLIGGWAPRSDPGRPVWSGLSALALLLAVIAMATNNAWWLGAFLGCVAVLWMGTTLAHAGFHILRARNDSSSRTSSPRAG